MQIRQEKGCYTLYKENEAIGTAVVDGTTILRLEVVPRWRGRGYGSYLLKEILRQNGGLDPKQATRFTAPLPRDAAGRALAQKYGFAPDGSQLVRRRVPDLSAVQLCHAFLTARLAPGGLLERAPGFLEPDGESWRLRSARKAPEEQQEQQGGGSSASERVLIVGAGLAGAMTAWELAQRGSRAVVVDARP